MSTTLILSGGQVILGLAAVAAAVYLGIFAAKTYLRQQGEIARHKSDGPQSATVRKYEAVDIKQHARNIKMAGLTSALAVVLIVFAWTQFTSERVLAEFYPELETIEMDIPPTSQQEPRVPALPPPPSPNPTQIEEVDNVQEVPEEEPVKEISESLTPSTYTGPTDENAIEMPAIESIEIEEEKEEEVKEEKIFMIVEQMPRFPGCEEQAGTHKDKKLCADKQLLKYIYDNIRYPQMAIENGIEGFATISFVVSKDGSIRDAKILREPGGGCGKEALRVVNKMNKLGKKWTPGKQRGRPVEVQYTLPVRFKLN